MQVDSESERDEQPKRHSRHSPHTPPIPFAPAVGREVINEIKRQQDKKERDGKLKNLPGDSKSIAETEVVGEGLTKMSTIQNYSQSRDNHDRQRDRQKDGHQSHFPPWPPFLHA